MKDKNGTELKVGDFVDFSYPDQASPPSFLEKIVAIDEGSNAVHLLYYVDNCFRCSFLDDIPYTRSPEFIQKFSDEEVMISMMSE